MFCIFIIIITVHLDLHSTRKLVIHSAGKVERKPTRRIQLQCVGKAPLRSLNFSLLMKDFDRIATPKTYVLIIKLFNNN